MYKVILFKESTSKADLINNEQSSIIGVLDEYALSANIEYNLDSNHILTVLIDTELAGNIIHEIGEKQIIKVKGQNEVYDYFVITGVDKTLSDVEIVARHWTIEATSSIFIIDSKPRNLNGINMITHLVRESEEYKKNKQFAHDLELMSNITKSSSLNVFHSSLQNDLAKIQENFNNAEIGRQGFELSLVDYVGSKNVKYTVEYGVNLISNTTEELYEIVTGVLPKGYDKLYGDIQYSSLFDSNANKTGITTTIEYAVRLRVAGEQEEEGYTYFDKEEQAIAELNRLAKLEFTQNKVDEPIISFSTKYVDLGTIDGSTTNQTFLSVGDLVETKIKLYNITVRTRVVQFKYDVLSKFIEDVTLSNNGVISLKAPTVNQIQNTINNIQIPVIPYIPSNDDISDIAKNEIGNYISGGIGRYLRVFPDDIYILDSPNIENAVNVIRINKDGVSVSSGGFNGVYKTISKYLSHGNFEGVLFSESIHSNNEISFGDVSNVDRSRIEYASDKLMLGGKNSSVLSVIENDGSHIGMFEVDKIADNVGCFIQSFSSINLNENEIKNCIDVSAEFTNATNNTVFENNVLYTPKDDKFRYIYRGVQSDINNQIILDIPSEYVGRNYTIVGIAKFGLGDYFISLQEQDRFTIDTDRPMTMNIEISIE